MRRALLLAALLLAAGCTTAEAEPETHTVTVNFRLTDPDTAFYGCEGAGGYSDIGPGTSVTVRDGEGKVLGVGRLGAGKSSREGAQLTFCDWSAEVPGVPAGAGFYAAEVASRGEVTVSEAELAAEGWSFDVSLGS